MIDGSEGKYVRIESNALEHKRKRRPPRAVTIAYKQEVDALWDLRRARFAAIGDPDLSDSFSPGMIRPGVALWIERTRPRESMSTMTSRSTHRATHPKSGR